MRKLNFNISINASPSRVWNILWADKTYRQWTSVFDAGSYAESDWKEGSSVRFLSEPSQSGMFSVIEKLVPEKFMSFKHLGEVKNGVEQPISEVTKQWAGSIENYTLTETGDGTQLSVDVDMMDEHIERFNHDFPIALQMVKTLSEK